MAKESKKGTNSHLSDEQEFAPGQQSAQFPHPPLSLKQFARPLKPHDRSVFVPARQVWERYGVTSMTLHRWLADEKMGFPRPVYFGRFRYWRRADLEAFENRAEAVA